MGGLTEDGKYVDGSLWYYAPNNAAPTVFANFFLISGLCHLYQTYRYRSWRITGILPWSATLFVAGYILRAIGVYHYDNIGLFISSLVLLYAAPPIYELSNYFVLSRLLHYLPHHSPIHPGRILRTFIGASAIVELLTATGAARAANPKVSHTEKEVGKAILKATLVLQLVILAFFVTIAGKFHVNASRAGSLSNGKESGGRVKAVLLTLYLSSLFIGIRTIYRTVEYFSIANLHVTSDTQESDVSPLLRYEWFYWVFEAIPMVLNTWILNVRHPGRYLPKSIKTYVGSDGVERQGQGMKDRRSFMRKLMDPFDLQGLIKGVDQNNRWWEQEEAVDTERVGAAKTSTSG